MATSVRLNNIVRRLAFTVPANSTLDIETISLSDFKATKYLIEYRSTVENVFKSLELHAAKKSSEVNDTVYSKLGDVIAIDTNVVLSGSDIILRATNNESFDLVGAISKITL